MEAEKLKIAVFVDFDNIEIGVKTTLSRRFDIGIVLEAIKERGEVVSKSAYGNWKQAEGYSRDMTEHAVHMIQRNTTPGGDKNGADINLALDALETAFIRDHINAFVIVGGDSDFIALVEKLKQYDKKVFIVGGRAFTSVILQKNCHEFIAYENLASLQPAARKAAEKEPTPAAARLEAVMPLMRRALKVLIDREVSPQLGLLKSTLLQLDSTFTERDYATATFREFIQKLARAGLVHLKHVDRSLLVELRDGEPPQPAPVPPPAPEPGEAPAAPIQGSEGLERMRTAFESATQELRWPMYLRNIRQFLKTCDPYFDERRCSFSRIHDLVKEGHRVGLFRVERDRQGGLRVFPGQRFPVLQREWPAEEAEDQIQPAADPAIEPAPESAPEPEVGTLPEPVVDAPAFVEAAPESSPEAEIAPPRRTRRSPARTAKPASRGRTRAKSTRKAVGGN